MTVKIPFSLKSVTLRPHNEVPSDLGTECKHSAGSISPRLGTSHSTPRKNPRLSPAHSRAAFGLPGNALATTAVLKKSEAKSEADGPWMAAYTQAECVIKNIIREIGQECAHYGESVSETLVAFMVKAVVLDPSNGFNMDRNLTRADVQKLVKLCVNRLLDKKNPSLDTIKMQVYFDMNYTNRGEFLDEHHRVLESRLGIVSREITDNRARTREELESLYRKIVSYILLRSGLGSPTDIKVVREATVPAILNEAIPATTQHIDAQLQTSQEEAYQYTAILEKLLENPLKMKELEDLKIKEALFNLRQYEIFLNIILSDIITCAQEVEMMIKQLGAQMEQLKMTVQAKTAVPTSQVYPIFIALSSLWTSFQDETVLLSVLSNLTTHLAPFLGYHEELFNTQIIQELLDEVEIKSDVHRIKESMGTKVNINDFKKLDWIFPETTANFDKLPIQYRGFCGYTFAVKDGLLVPGNPAIGILKYKERYYTFSSKEAAYTFAENPDKYIELIGEKAKKCAELIQLLELHQQFETMIPYTQVKIIDRHIKPITKCESSTQTDTHIMPPTIIKDYEWNEWELRRKAIKLVCSNVI
ncbi:cilia- and flagella-associated protein 206 [Gracilinanus agilis]|uniref:cilia- and flagella-associated protein 206 n=1 Tax=Gracilinanus agilis TaxID=191870 RepID=UPI001CFF1B2E|nr:cilia- and flagella-associated protein 206 [Gracilinanus agilis]